MNAEFMHRCLQLASGGRGNVANGAMVGAVLVRDGKVIAEGFHAGYAQAHAEAQLFERFTGKVEPSDILYVNLEPCCHQGKTPPCTNLLINKGVKTVVYGMLDPDVRVAGKGIAELQAAGVNVIGPMERARCEYFNRGFISVRSAERPWITLKRAQTLYGVIAHDDGKPMKITSPEQDAWSHQWLRGTHDAILVGVGTILSDNPRLNRRCDQNNHCMEGSNEKYQPYKIVLDSSLRVPEDAKVVMEDSEHLIVITSPSAAEEKIAALQKRGVRVFKVPVKNECFEWKKLWGALTSPQDNFFGITSLLVEGGARTWECFESQRQFDERVELVG